MKKYKHKHTGLIAKLDLSNQKYYNVKGNSIPYEIIENSNDWEEINEDYIGENCNKVQKRMECLKCNYPYSEAQIKDDGSKHFDITKPEYTILSFKHKKGSIWEHYKNDNEDWYRICVNGACGKLEYYLKEKNYSIHSLRRESDGEIFTVSDITCIGKIKSFELGAEQNLGIIIVHGEFSQQLSHITKVKPKEWEITAFRNKDRLKEIVKPEWRNAIDLELNYEIYSVKRLSDGEEFKIGDRISLIGKDDCDELITIKLDNNKIMFNGYINEIQHYKKAKQPLFTTAQKEEIIEIIKEFNKK